MSGMCACGQKSAEACTFTGSCGMRPKSLMKPVKVTLMRDLRIVCEAELVLHAIANAEWYGADPMHMAAALAIGAAVSVTPDGEAVSVPVFLEQLKRSGYVIVRDQA